MRVHHGADADMNLIKSKTAAIIGFGTQGSCPCSVPMRQWGQKDRCRSPPQLSRSCEG